MFITTAKLLTRAHAGTAQALEPQVNLKGNLSARQQSMSTSEEVVLVLVCFQVRPHPCFGRQSLRHVKVGNGQGWFLHLAIHTRFATHTFSWLSSFVLVCFHNALLRPQEALDVLKVLDIRSAGRRQNEISTDRLLTYSKHCISRNCACVEATRQKTPFLLVCHFG